MKKEMAAAAASAGAAAGVAFASGREAVLFFAQFGSASWLAVGVASVTFGVMCAGVCAAVRRTGACGAGGVFLRLMGPASGKVFAVLYGVLMVLAATMMLFLAGRLAALALNIKNAFCMGVLGSLAAALILNEGTGARMTVVGMMVLAAGCVYHIGLWADGRGVELLRRYEVVVQLENCIPAAAGFGVMHASLAVCAAMDAAVRMTQEIRRPVLYGLFCALSMLLLTAPLNAALIRGGKKLFVQAYPTVLLAARWGKTGFYIASGYWFFCCTTTLSAVVGAFLKKNFNCVKL